jgi:hypothetical protein
MRPVQMMATAKSALATMLVKSTEPRERGMRDAVCQAGLCCRYQSRSIIAMPLQADGHAAAGKDEVVHDLGLKAVGLPCTFALLIVVPARPCASCCTAGCCTTPIESASGSWGDLGCAMRGSSSYVVRRLSDGLDDIVGALACDFREPLGEREYRDQASASDEFHDEATRVRATDFGLDRGLRRHAHSSD